MNNQQNDSVAHPRGFTSDNIAGVSPEVMDALVACNAGQATPYGNDALSQRLERRISEIFEHEARVFLVSTGSAANALSLAGPVGNTDCTEHSCLVTGYWLLTGRHC